MTPQNTRAELVCFEKEGSCCSNSGIRCVTIANNPPINHKRGKECCSVSCKTKFIDIVCPVLLKLRN